MLERLFHTGKLGSTIPREVFAGFTTFFAMSYIIFLQPAILSGALTGTPTGMDFEAVLSATILASAFATALMGFLANYPIGLAPGMGQNFYFTISVIPAATAAGATVPWQAALGAVFIAGILFFLVSISGLRRLLISAVSPSMRRSMGGGIGLFIAFIGLRNAGLIADDPGTLIALSHPVVNSGSLTFLFGILLTTALISRKVPAAIFIGMLGSFFIALILSRFGNIENELHLPDSLFSIPPSPLPVLGKLDLAFALSPVMIPILFVLLFMDLFDTSGTLLAVGGEAGLLDENGDMPGMEKAFIADSVGTVAGAFLGTSTVTSYIESGAGIEAGGRTGLTAILVSLLFLLSLFFLPLIRSFGSVPAITAPALFIVGVYMIRNVSGIEWNDFSEAIPSFATLIGIPLFFSIGYGIALGLFVYPVTKLLAGKHKEIKATQIVLSVMIGAFFLYADHFHI